MNKLSRTGSNHLQNFFWGWVGASSSAVLGTVYIFREFFFNGLLAGDLGDGRAIVSYTNHWYHFFRGEVALRDYSFFWPATDTLGGTDPLLFQGIVTTLLRLVGLNAVLAMEWSFIVLTFIGLYGAFSFSKNYFKRTITPFIFTILIATSYGLNAQLGHPQLLAFSIIFWVLNFATKAQKTSEVRLKFNYFLAAITVLSVLANTSWYAFEFFLILVTIFLLLSLRGLKYNKIKKEFLLFLSLFRNKLNSVSLFLYFTFSSMVSIWLYIYFPYLKGGITSWPWSEVSFYAQRPRDVINTSVGAFFPTSALNASLSLDVNPTFERAMGINLILLVTFVYVLLDLRFRFSNYKYSLLARLIQTALLVELFITFTDTGKSLWWFFWKVFPGAGSIRAVNRMNILIVWIVLFVVIAYFDKIKYVGRKKVSFVFVVLLLYFASNVRESQSFWNENDYLPNNFQVQAKTLVDQNCSAFLLYQNADKPLNAYIQFEAMAISEATGIPTINGSSGKFPPNWAFGANEKISEEKISSWLKNYNATHLRSKVCLLED